MSCDACVMTPVNPESVALKVWQVHFYVCFQRCGFSINEVTLRVGHTYWLAVVELAPRRDVTLELGV